MIGYGLIRWRLMDRASSSLVRVNLGGVFIDASG